MSANNTSSSGFTAALGVFGALIGFAVVTALFQIGSKPEDHTSAERLKNKQTVADEQTALLAKYAMETSAKAEAVFAKATDQLKTRKVAASSMAVPGSPTALKQAAATAPAPAPAAAAKPAPAANAPAAPAPNPSAAPAK